MARSLLSKSIPPCKIVTFLPDASGRNDNLTGLLELYIFKSQHFFLQNCC